MSQGSQKAAPVAAKSNSTTVTHEPAREAQPTPELEDEKNFSFLQRAAGALGGASPHTPPANFGALLEHANGSATLRAGLLGQLQQRYGNRFVGQIIRRKAAGRQATDAGAEAEPFIQPRGAGEAGAAGKSAAPAASVGRTLAPGDVGRPLDLDTRADMERRFGHDFHDVHVHTDAGAAAAARQLKADAFTAGRDIYFAAGRFQPQRLEGRQLLAHELTHVLQQRAGAGPPAQHKSWLGAPDDAFEQEADEVAGRLFAAGPHAHPAAFGPRTLGAPPAVVQRQPNTAAGMTRADAPASDVAPEQNSSSAGTMDTDRLEKIKKILDNGWVGPFDEYGLQDIWNSFGTDLPHVAAQNFDLWNECVERGAELYDLPALQPMRDAFKQAVIDQANEYLDENEMYIRDEMELLGLTDTEKEQTEEQRDAFAEVQKAATLVADAIKARDAFLQVTVGIDYEFNKDATPLQQKHSKYYGKQYAAQFNPDKPHPAPLNEPPPPPYAGKPLPTWEETNKQYQKAVGLITGFTTLYPSIFALVRDKKVGDVATGKDPKDARGTMAKSMTDVLVSISETRTKLGDTLYLELHPIHDQLFAEGKPWSEPFGKSLGEYVVKDYESTETLKSVGLGLLAGILFAVANIATLGTATFWFAAVGGSVAAGVQAGRSWSKFSDLQTAEKTSIDNEVSLLAEGAADSALLEAVLDTVFAFLDVYAVGSRLARAGGKVLSGTAKTLAQAEATEAKLVARQIEEVGKREAAQVVEQETAEQIGRGLGGRIKDALAAFISHVKQWAAGFFEEFKFRSFEVEDEGEYIVVYGRRSPRVVLARIKKNTITEWLIDNTDEVKQLRHTRASRLGAARAARAKGKAALANALRGGAVQISEQLGEIGAEAAVLAQFPGAKLIHRGAGSGTLDLIFRDVTGEIIVVEAKGGAGKLITRQVSGSTRAMQGTVTYLRSVLGEMGLRVGESAAADEVMEALLNGRVRYFVSRTPKLSGTGQMVTKLAEFR